MQTNRKLRMGMIGGSTGAFIGAIHRNAALMDGEIELVCGAFSSSSEKSKATGKALFLPDNRIYNTYEEMITAEKKLDPDKRMDFVAIVTPNYLHFPQAKLALENGFHVICDKPMTMNLEEAEKLARIVEQTGLEFALTHNYTGYPMVKQTREMVRDGSLGKIRKIVVEYSQGFLKELIEDIKNRKYFWRADPEKGGDTLTMGDIGTHAENLAEYITGLEPEELLAELGPIVPGRKMDDDVNILIRYKNKARGVFVISQASTGEENNLKFKIYGEKAGIEWAQMEPNSLKVMWAGKPMEILRAGNNMPGLSEIARANCRLPAGHPEGFIEAFANLYRNFARTLRMRMDGKTPDPTKSDFPDVYDGLRGMAFINVVLESANNNGKWVRFER